LNNREYTNKYIWNKFKSSLFTQIGLVIPAISSIAMMATDMPVILQSFNILGLVGFIGGSYWWHWSYNINEFAKEGSDEYLLKKEISKKTILDEKFADLKLNSKYRILKRDLKDNYSNFLKALKEQKIISDLQRNKFKIEAEKSYEVGLDILAEISDILAVMKSVNIKEIEKLDSDIAHSILESYSENEIQLEKLTKSLNAIIHSYTLAISKLAAVTSNTNIKEKIFNENDLQLAIDEAKLIKEKIGALSSTKEEKLKNKYDKYL
jgi:hypothetical protein